MYLRAVGSLLTRSRRVSPRGIPRTPAHAQVDSSPGIVSQSQVALGVAAAAVGRPARSLHTLRDLANGGDGALGAAAVSALAGSAGLLYFKKASDESAAGEMPDKEEVPDKKPISEGDMDEAAIKAMFVDKDGNFYWPGYLDFIASQRLNDGRTYKKAFSGKNAMDEVTDDREAVKEDEAAMKEDETAMKARFEDWMKQHGRTYKNEEEKAMRYERFKKVAKFADKRNALKPSGACLDGPNNLADLTEEEFRLMDGRQGDFDWEGYLDRVNSLIAQGRVASREKR